MNAISKHNANCSLFFYISQPTGSEDERRVYEKANELVAVPKGDQPPVPSDVTIKLKVSEGMNVGNDFDVFAIINNNTDEEKECRFRFCARTVNYTGAVGPECGMMDLPDLKLEAHAGNFDAVACVILLKLHIKCHRK